jgi:hypothetical protein
MDLFMQEWNKSVSTLVHKLACRPPEFKYDPELHNELVVQMSDASDLYIPTNNDGGYQGNLSKIQIKTNNTTGKRASQLPNEQSKNSTPASTPTKTQSKSTDGNSPALQKDVVALQVTGGNAQNSAPSKDQAPLLQSKDQAPPHPDNRLVKLVPPLNETSTTLAIPTDEGSTVDRLALERLTIDGPAQVTPSSLGMSSSTGSPRDGGRHPGVLKQPIGISPLILDLQERGNSALGASTLRRNQVDAI